MTAIAISGPLFEDDGTTNPQFVNGGSGYVIGDGYVLTAGHVVFEYNHSHD